MTFNSYGAWILFLMLPLVLFATSNSQNQSDGVQELKAKRISYENQRKNIQREAERVRALDWSLYKKFLYEDEYYSREIDAINQELEKLEKNKQR